MFLETPLCAEPLCLINSVLVALCGGALRVKCLLQLTDDRRKWRVEGQLSNIGISSVASWDINCALGQTAACSYWECEWEHRYSSLTRANIPKRAGCHAQLLPLRHPGYCLIFSVMTCHISLQKLTLWALKGNLAERMDVPDCKEQHLKFSLSTRKLSFCVPEGQIGLTNIFVRQVCFRFLCLLCNFDWAESRRASQIQIYWYLSIHLRLCICPEAFSESLYISWPPSVGVTCKETWIHSAHWAAVLCIWVLLYAFFFGKAVTWKIILVGSNKLHFSCR